jgi:two-component system, NarL family, nitrate/nitrite response regulator NarL
MTGLIRIAVIDRHPLYREGVIQALREVSIFDVIATGGGVSDAVRIAGDRQPDVMLLDSGLPGGGLAAAKAIMGSSPNIKILMLTTLESEHDGFIGFEIGVRGYVPKCVDSSELVSMITAVSRGEFAIAPRLAGRMLARVASPLEQAHAKLTTRENQIFSLVARGQANKEIARTLQLSDRTVKHRMTVILRKLGARNRVEAVINMQQTGNRELQ